MSECRPHNSRYFCDHCNPDVLRATNARLEARVKRLEWALGNLAEGELCVANLASGNETKEDVCLHCFCRAALAPTDETGGRE